MSETEVVENSGERTRVGFPEVPPDKPKSNKGLVVVIAILLILLGVGGWFMFGRQSNLSLTGESTPTPTEMIEATSTPIPTEAEKEVVREGVKIQVLNGTGISGAASELQKKLETLGYEDIKVGNASQQNAVNTLVVFNSSVDDAVREDIIKLLETSYEEVTESERSMTDFDVVITTGNPVGGRPATPTRSAASLTKTPTPTRSTTGTITVTPTKTPTPTP